MMQENRQKKTANIVLKKMDEPAAGRYKSIM